MEEHSNLPLPAPLAGARFAALFAGAPFSVQILSVQGRTLAVNAAWSTLWGVTPGDGIMEYVLGKYNVLEDPQLAAKGVTPFLKRVFAGEPVTIPRMVYDPGELGLGGRARWIEAHAYPVKDADGHVREVILIHEDVTDRVQARNALQASELRLKQLANTIPQLAWMAEPDGNIHWYNDRWYEYTGKTPDEMEGWGWQAVHDPAVLPDVVDTWKRSLATGTPFQMTFPLKGKDGAFRPFFTLVAPLKDEEGRVVQWFGTNTDVSPLQQAQDAVRKAEERLRLAMDAGNIGIWDWDVAQNEVTWSDRVYALHGLQPGEFGGKVENFTALVHRDDLGGLHERIQEALQRTSLYSAEFRVVLPDGSHRWLSTWARVHRDVDGKPERMVGATISIDDYKKAEAALKEASERKDEFLAMLAHELRNPLAPITSAAHLLGLPHTDEQRVRFASDIIRRQARHMTALVDDLLDVSRVTRGRVQLKKEDLDLRSVIGSAVEQVAALLAARGHTLTTSAAMEGILVHGDRTRLVQAIANMLDNAVKYTRDGGRIELRVELTERAARVIVQDNGTGIDAEFLPRVFDLFTQAERTPDRAQGGLGIGLALVKSIATLHGGSVEVASEGLGKGTTFTLCLPLASPAPQGATPAGTTPSARATSLAIMIVDDNSDAAHSLAAVLATAGHRVSVERNAHDALAAAAGAAPQVFILDIGMPGMDGYELARRLRATAGAGQALLIALTGYGDTRDRELSAAAGFDHHFVKPVDLDQLAAVLARGT